MTGRLADLYDGVCGLLALPAQIARHLLPRRRQP